MGPHELACSLLHDFLIQMLRIEPCPVYIEGVPDPGIIDPVSIFLPGTGSDGIEIFMDIKSLCNDNIRRKMRI